MTSREKAEALLKKYYNGTASPKERRIVERWYHQQILERKLEEKDAGFMLSKDALWKEISRKSGLDTPQGRPRKNLMWRRAGLAAAVAGVLLACGLWIFDSGKLHSPSAMKSASSRSVPLNDVPPGGNRATLILEDGRKVELEETASGIIMSKGAVTYADGEPVLSTGNTRGDIPHAPAYAILQTPKGGTYQVTLPDGTRVWLNADSRIRYPLHFPEEGPRVVELKGEAFFDVRSLQASGKNQKKIPFLVQTPRQRIEVLGTRFNVSAYPDEQTGRTTLTEGRVRVSLPGSGREALLHPGQQAIAGNAGLQVLHVNTEVVTAWTSGIFIFDNTPLKEVMRQIMRWYDVEADLQDLPQRQITGIVSREEKLSALLRALKLSSGLEFTINERRLILKKE